ncbi:MAG: hypothetical protein COV29_00335 [Candidatus Yanofskybacteria bacterium CG10_big_fil_rev_8_21_14_0_10_36_16]|uniref:DAC domain-containing protein n=1 Tax=Candidatus Yanofskybacteria bacterium CG10_big_fil_rev_8_21_14_0_10_36_16 TaxID=1975096 RepID=A0A2J0Q8L5_9BACT|nr:MAG: hypothetical protein COV29_00335 [Candidatus Yanofskybacteria bacterium CG10_big_fil_rev_8_21_14_0_10_36_16]
MKKSSNKKVVTVSGGFDPLHIGHVRLFRSAKKLGDKLVVILNNDNWLKKKKGFVFMPQNERREMIEAINCVDEVVLSKHKKNPKDMSVCSELATIKPDIFVNGGDRFKNNIPEVQVCNEIGCKMVFNAGAGGKIQSSSWLLDRYGKIMGSSKKNPIKTQTVKKLSESSKTLKESKTKLPYDFKMKLIDFIIDLTNRKKNFGLFIILGWKNKWNNYTDISDSEQDIFDKNKISILDLGHKKTKGHDIETTINFDGAILIDERGDILHSGVMVEGMRPRTVANKVSPGKFKDLSDQFGFQHKVHTRHLSAISASYVFKGTTVFTVSEETNDLHVYENGKIIYFTP